MMMRLLGVQSGLQAEPRYTPDNTEATLVNASSCRRRRRRRRRRTRRRRRRREKPPTENAGESMEVCTWHSSQSSLATLLPYNYNEHTVIQG